MTEFLIPITVNELPSITDLQGKQGMFILPDGSININRKNGSWFHINKQSDHAGVLDPSDTVTVQPGNAKWYWAGPGTYNNVGTGIVIQKLGIISYNGVKWSFANIDLPNVKLKIWSASAYLSGEQVINPNDSCIYEAKLGVIAGDVPGQSSKWERKVGLIAKQTFDPSNNFETSSMKGIAEYLKKPESLGGVLVSGGEPDVSPALNFTASNSYIDAQGNIQSNPGTDVSDFVAVPTGSYTKVIADESGLFTLATYGTGNVFIATLGGAPGPEFNKSFTLNSNVKSVRYIRRQLNIVSAKLTFKSDVGGGMYTLPWLIPSGNQVQESEFKQNVRDISASFDFSLNPIVGNVIVIGDSTVAAYAGGTAIIDIISVTGTKTNIAYPGDTILQQQDRYQSLSSGVKTAANFVIVQIGLNDIAYTGNSNAAIVRMQTFINIIKVGSPSAKIIVCSMIPAFKAWQMAQPANANTAYKNWRQLNYFYQFGLSNVDKFIGFHTDHLSDGNGNLDLIYDTGDGVHDNTAGRKLNAYSWISNYKK